MKRIGILTAGGDTPALNATLYGAATRANQLKVELIGFIKGFSSLLYPHVPHIQLNPLFTTIPELRPTRGGSILGASRDYVPFGDANLTQQIGDRLKKLNIDGLICIGGDGTLSGMQTLQEVVPSVLAPKTIDNDLGLNYHSEADEWSRTPGKEPGTFKYERKKPFKDMDLNHMVNYATPGYATAVFVSAGGVQRIRTTAESHRRIAIIEVMGRHAGYLALGSAYGQPDILLVPESPLDEEIFLEKVKDIYDLQKHAVIVCAEGVVDNTGRILGAATSSTDPAGNIVLSGAAEALRELLIRRLGDAYFTAKRRNESAKAAVFTRKVGHTQRGGRPILFDRYYATQLGGHAIDMLLEGQTQSVAILQWSEDRGFYLDSVHGNTFRDRWGTIHSRSMHPAFYDPYELKPSRLGIQYLDKIFTNSLGSDDMEEVLQSLFDLGNLVKPYHSVNVDINKRIRFLNNGDAARQYS